MASVKGTNFTNITSDPIVKIDSGEWSCKMRAQYDTFEASALASGSDISVARLPKGAKVYDIVVGPKQISDLLGTTQVTSSDFNTVKALANCEINSFLGFNFITSNRLSIASSKRLCLAFAMDGIKLALGQDIMTRIDERSDKGYATQVYVCMTMGATRMEEEKVVTIEAHEA